MAHRPYVDFAEVKQCITLPEVLEAFGLSGQFTRTGNKLQGVCPLPEHQHGPSPNPEQFKIDFKEGIWLWHCFGDCQKGGDVIEFCKAMTAYDDAHIRLWLADKFGDRLTLKKPGKKAEKAVKKDTTNPVPPAPEAPAIPAAAPPLSDSHQVLQPLRFVLNLDPEVPYLQQRGVTAETIKRYGLGLCRKGVLAGYVAMPVTTLESSNPVAYLGRWPGEDYAEGEGRPRYKWPKDSAKSQILYGLPQALEGTGGKALIVVEGPFGLFHLAESGFQATVAVVGAALSEEQARLLEKTGRLIVLLFDGDEAGLNGMRSAAAKLITRVFVRVVKLPTGKQPDGLSAEQLKKLLSFLA